MFDTSCLGCHLAEKGYHQIQFLREVVPQMGFMTCIQTETKHKLTKNLKHLNLLGNKDLVWIAFFDKIQGTIK